jgi:hypothetical protein
VGADINARNAASNTVLHLACAGADLISVTKMLELDADVTCVNDADETAMYLTCSGVGGAETPPPPTSIATEYIGRSRTNLRADIVKTLFSNCATVDDRCRRGETPLFRAVRSLWEVVSRFRLERQALETALHRHQTFTAVCDIPQGTQGIGLSVSVVFCPASRLFFSPDRFRTRIILYHIAAAIQPLGASIHIIFLIIMQGG